MTQAEIIERKNTLYTERMNMESQLSSSDYKVIKCAEAQAAELPLPYDISSLHAERQAMRDRINEIDAELEELDATEPEDEQVNAE